MSGNPYLSDSQSNQASKTDHVDSMRAVSPRMRSYGCERQNGIAIITVLLVIALSTIIVASMTGRQQIDIRREQNEAGIQMARSLAISGERFAAAVLYRDFQDGDRENTDSLEDDWAQTLPPVPINEATLSGCVVDMQGKFNLNNLINSEGKANPVFVDQFTRLLKVLNIDTAKAQAVVDWLDENVDPTLPDGAEDDYYSGLEVPYRAPNSVISSISELNLVKGFNPAVEEERADYELLIPHITVLPVTDGFVPLNINTATPELLSSLSDFMETLGPDMTRWDSSAYEDYPVCENIFDLAAEEVEGALTQDRDYTPYVSTLEFEEDADPGGGSGELIAEAGTIAVTSRYYQVRIDIAMEGVTVSQYTLMERDPEGRVKVISRSRDAL